MEKVLIIGAGPQARVIPDVAASCSEQELLGFVHIEGEKKFLKKDTSQIPIYEEHLFPGDLLERLGKFSVLIGTDNIKTRYKVIERIKTFNLTLANIIHPSLIMAPSANMGTGNLILPGVIIGSGATIGDHVILNSGVSIDHDANIQDNVIITPGVHFAGSVTVGKGSFIGIGVNCINDITIGQNCIIAAGSVITKDIPDGVLAAGVPAKVIRNLV